MFIYVFITSFKILTEINEECLCKCGAEVFVCIHQPVLEVMVDHPVGETFTADTDTLKYTVTSQLMHNQTSIDDTWNIVQELIDI